MGPQGSQRGLPRGGRWALASLLLAALSGLSSVAQAQSANCTVTITQASGSFRSEVACTGNTQPNVTVGRRAWLSNSTFSVLNHTATYSWNGAAAVPIPEDDGRFSDVSPALVTIGFVPSRNSSTATALPTLHVKAMLRNLSLPIGAVASLPGSYIQQAISGVKLTAFGELQVRDSEVESVTSALDSNLTSFGAIKVVKDAVMSGPAIVRVTNSSFQDGACSKDCGALLIQNGDAFEMISIVSSNFTNNQGGGNGAALYVDACPLAEVNMHINSSSFTGNYAKGGDGAGAFLGVGCSPIIYNSTFSGNRAGKSGGGLSLHAARGALSTLHVVDCTFANNTAASDPCEIPGACFDRVDRCGGAMHVNSPTTMLVEGSNFTGNSNRYGYNGGAVCYGQVIHDSRNPGVTCDGWIPLGSEGGVFRDCRFENNIATFKDGFGGAVFDWASDGITLDGCTFVNNTAGNGGALYALRTQTVSITGGTTFENCSSTQFGGGAVAAVHVQLTFSVDGAEFINNICNSTDSASQGGGLYLEDSVEGLNGCDLLVNYSATIKNAVFDRNKCDTKGALAVYNVDDITIGPNVNFTRNVAAVAPSSGGAVGMVGTSENTRLAHPHRVLFTGCRFDSNQAQSEGGALFFMGIWLPVIEDCLFINNNISTSSTFTLENYGGAVFVGELESDAGIVISRSRFVQNRAFGAGAMIVYASNLTMTDCEFVGNVCVENAGAYFWTQAASSTKSFQQTITNTTFRDNSALVQGGGLLSQHCGLVVDGCTFENNWALVTGGAGLFVLSSSVPDPGADQPNTFGPLYPLPTDSFTPPTTGKGLEANGAVYLLNSYFRNNSAGTAGGGAVAITQQSQVLVNNCTFVENTSPKGSGGAISGSSCRGSINIYGSSFLNNSASSSGGAIYSTSCNLTLMDSNLVNNSAATAGALNSQLSVQDAGSLSLAFTELVDCACSGNVATTSDGGCVVADSVHLRLQGVSVVNNTAQLGLGGAAFLVNSVQSPSYQYRSTLFNCTVEGNSASSGGGVAINGAGIFLDVSDGTVFENNSAVAPSVEGASGFATGGCLHVRGCQGLLIRGQSSFNNCSASAPSYSKGGAIMIDSCETLVVDQVSISNSRAAVGGGMAVLDVQAVLVINSTIQGNVAGGNNHTLPPSDQNIQYLIGAGGGAWFGGNTSGFMQGTKISGNVANTVGGGAMVHLKCPAGGGKTALVASEQPWAQMFQAMPDSYSEFLAQLQSLTLDQCFSLTIQQSRIVGNRAQQAGGGLFLTSVTGFQSAGCDDLNYPASAPAPVPPLAPFVARSDLSDLVGCIGEDSTTSNTVVVGYGPDLATMPSKFDIVKEDIGVDDGWTYGVNGPTVPRSRFVRTGSGTFEDRLVLPAMSPPIYALMPLLITDAAGQPIYSSLISGAIVVNVIPSGMQRDEQDISGKVKFVLAQRYIALSGNEQRFPYQNENGQIIIPHGNTFVGLEVRAVPDRNYTFGFSVGSSIQGADEVPVRNITVTVPNCGNGQEYISDIFVCRMCNPGYYSFAPPGPGIAPSSCLPCPDGAICGGGAVLVPDDMNWHSAPNSVNVLRCINDRACKRSKENIQMLQNCQIAWYNFLNLKDTMTDYERDLYGARLLQLYNCSMLSVGNLYDRLAYQSLLCAEGYGGNLCGVCVPMYDGTKTALQSSSLCGVCGPQWQVVLLNLAFFIVNLVLIFVSVLSAMGEQILSDSINFSDIIGLLVMHLQYLVVVLRIQMRWPNEVASLTRTVSTVTNFADQSTALGCLSSTGTPESQAVYSMVGKLFLPAALILVAMVLWIIFRLVRYRFVYPRMVSRSADSDAQQHAPSSFNVPVTSFHIPGQPGLSQPPRVQPSFNKAALFTFPEEQPNSASSYIESGPALSHQLNGTVTATITGTSPLPPPAPPLPPAPSPLPPRTLGSASHVGCGQYPDITDSPTRADAAKRSATATHYRTSASFQLPPSMGTSATFAHGSTPMGSFQRMEGSVYGLHSPSTARSTMRLAQGDIYAVDEAEDRPQPYFDDPEKSKKMRAHSIVRWQLPGAETVPVATTWLSLKGKNDEEEGSYSLMEKLQLLDKYMPLHLQLCAVAIISAFVVYEGWCSAALSVFSCQYIDSGAVQDPQPEYYASFQAAANPNGYWRLNMNQPCYEGEHWTKWTPIGIVMSIVVCLGIPFVTFLPVFLNRKTLATAKSQMYWGWIYMRFFWGRVPYWAAFAQLELLSLVITQNFTAGLESNLQQAAILLVVLLVILVINTTVWPHVHPLMMILSFLSFAVLTLTVALSILIGDGSAATLSAAAAACVGALMIIINVLYVLMLFLACYKHTQDILEEKYKRLQESATGVIKNIKTSSKDASAKVRNAAFVASRKLTKATDDSRVFRNMFSVMKGGRRRERSTTFSRSTLSGMQSHRLASIREASNSALSEVDDYWKDTGPVQEHENGAKQA